MPNALSIGVPYETFWHLNPKKLEPFYEADRKKKDYEAKVRDQQAWLNGMYVAQAIGAAFSKSNRYPERPLSEEERRTDADNFRDFARQFNRANGKKKK